MSTPAGTEDPRGSELADHRSLRSASMPGRWVVAAMVLASSSVVLSVTTSAVAAPTISARLGTDLTGLLWVVNAYPLALTALLLPAGTVVDVLGHRRILLVGLRVFVTTSLACSIAPDLATLIVARLGQGAAAAFVTPAVLAVMEESFDDQDRDDALGRWVAGAAFASLFGPALGGFTTDAAGWRWVFVLPVPFALAAIAVTVRHLPRSARPMTVATPDWVAAALMVIAVGGASTGLIWAGATASIDLKTAIALTAALLAVGTLVTHQKRASRPLIPHRDLRSRRFLVLNLYTLLVYFALGGGTLITTLLLQLDLGWSASKAGAAVLPLHLLLVLLSPAVSHAARRFGASWFLSSGALLIAVGMASLTRVSGDSSYLLSVLPAMLLWGLGAALMISPLTMAVVGLADEHDVGIASSVNCAAASLASLLAATALPALASTTTDLESISSDTGLHRALLIASAVALAGSALSVPRHIKTDSTPVHLSTEPSQLWIRRRRTPQRRS